MRVASRRAVGDHRHGLARSMARPVEDLHVEHGGKATQALRADPLRIHGVENVDSQLFYIGLRPARFQLAHVDRVHQALLGQPHAMFRRTADPDAEHTRRAPASTHRRHLFDHPVDDIVARVHHLELGLVLAAPALGGDIDADRVARHHLDRQHARGIVARVAAGEGRIGEDAGAQLVVRVVIGLPHPLIDHVLQAALAVQAAVLPPFDEHIDDAGILADRPVPFGAHPAVGQDLRDRILGCRALLCLVGLAQRADVIHRVVVGDELQRVGHAFDEIIFANYRHVAHRRAPPADRNRSATRAAQAYATSDAGLGEPFRPL